MLLSLPSKNGDVIYPLGSARNGRNRDARGTEAALVVNQRAENE